MSRVVESEVGVAVETSKTRAYNRRKKTVMYHKKRLHVAQFAERHAEVEARRAKNRIDPDTLRVSAVDDDEASVAAIKAAKKARALRKRR